MATTALKLGDLLSFAWSYTNSRVVDYYRHYLSEMVTVNTKSGPVKGFKIASAFDFHYINFIGIPYAKPPIGELRFKVCVHHCNTTQRLFINAKKIHNVNDIRAIIDTIVDHITHNNSDFPRFTYRIHNHLNHPKK